MKYSLGIFALIIVFALVPNQWNTASAQTPISFNFSGSGGLTSGGGVLLTGSGTLNPYGPTTIAVTTQNSGTSFTVTFANGSTWTATSTAVSSGGMATGTATIIGGTGTFAGATGSFNFTVLYTQQPGNTISFTVTGSGTINGSATLTYTYYFSQLAFAGGYQTTLTYINYGASPVTCTTSFYGDNGSSLAVPFADTTGGSTRTDTIAAGASIHDQTNASVAATGTQGWAEATCTGPVEASLLYRLYSSSGTAEAEASVNAETVPTSKLVTFAKSAAASTGVAYANPSTTQPATVTITAYNAAGVAQGSKVVALGPLQHGSSNVNAISASFTGSIVITSTSPIISLSLNAEVLNAQAFPVFSSLPPGDLSANPPTGAQTYYFSQVAFAGSFQSTLTYINYGANAVTCTTSFYDNNGNPLPVPFADTTGGSTRTDTIAAGGSIHDQTNANLTATGAQGWAQAMCTGPVEASLLYRYFDGSGTAEGEASVNAETAPTSKFVTFAQSAASASTGVAYANPSPTQSAVITIAASDKTGAALGSKIVTLGPLQHGSSNVNAISASFTGSIVITSTSPIVSLSLNAEAFPVFSSLPPGDLP